MSEPIRVVLAHGRAAELEIAATMSRLWGDAVLQGLQRVGSPYAGQVQIEYAFFGGLWRDDARPPMPVVTAPDGMSYTVQLSPEPAVIPATVAFGLPVGPIAKLFTTIAPDAALEGVLSRAIPDVFEYLEQPAWRDAANAIVAKACSTSGARVLIGFSMGTIVGYDVLRSAAGALPVKAFLTCGSPIGMKPIHERLLKTGPTPFPPGIGQWTNVWNEDDVATAVRGKELAALFGNGPIEDVETVGREPSLTNPFAAHNAPDYLSSLAMGLALPVAIESTAT
jgi:hypothetical protein